MLAKKDSRHSLKDRFIEEEEEEADVEDNSDQEQQSPNKKQQRADRRQRELSPSYSPRDLARKKSSRTEGEHHIESVTPIRYNPIKGILLGLLFTASVVGLVLLKYSKKMRKMVFYDDADPSSGNATHVFIEGPEHCQEISQVQRISYNNADKMVFCFKDIRYELHGHSWTPLTFVYAHEISKYLDSSLLTVGLSSEEAESRLALYGNNEHGAHRHTLLRRVALHFIDPLFIYLLLCASANILEGLTHGIVLVGLTIISIMVRELIRSRAEQLTLSEGWQNSQVKVIRDGGVVDIERGNLAPGDVFFPSDCIPCDAILLKGEISVDEVALTGESFPSPKFNLTDLSRIHDKGHWILQGSPITSVKPGTLAVAVHTGFGTRRGRILRRKKDAGHSEPQIAKRVMFFQAEVFCVGLIIYVVSLWRMQLFQVDTALKVIRLVDFASFALPPAFLLLFNIAYIFSSLRLAWKGITVLQPSKTVQGSRLKTLCFDKTGTLTESHVSISKIYSIGANAEVKREAQQIPERMLDVFACCHSIQDLDGQPKGDQIDLCLFKAAGGSLHPSNSEQRRVTVGTRSFQILRVNCHSSSHCQATSVLVRSAGGKFFIFVKGNPQSMHARSARLLPSFSSFTQEMGFRGYRLLGLGSKQVQPDLLQHYLLGDRDQYMEEIGMLGFVAFRNRIKSEAKQCIREMKSIDIATKVVTGDSVFLAVRVAFDTGIIDQQQKVTVIEGHRYDPESGGAQLVELTLTADGTIEQSVKRVDWFSYDAHGDDVYAIDHQFIKANPLHYFHDKVKIFARIPPQQKAQIIHKYKEHYRILVGNRKCFSGQPRWGVGMVGDGTNDLSAIQEADLGITMREGDAAKGAAHAVRDLSQIGQLMAESQNTEMCIFKMGKYLAMNEAICFAVTLILEEDCAFLTSNQFLIRNLGVLLPILIVMAAQRPNRARQKYEFSLEVFTDKNQLLFWGPIVLGTIGVALSYAIYSVSSDFQENQTHRWADFDQGWFGDTKSVSFTFLASTVLSIWLVLVAEIAASPKAEIGRPLRDYLSQKLPLIVIILLEAAFVLLLSFWDELGWAGLQSMARVQMGVMWGVMTGSGVLMILITKVILRGRVNDDDPRIEEESLME